MVVVCAISSGLLVALRLGLHHETVETLLLLLASWGRPVQVGDRRPGTDYDSAKSVLWRREGQMEENTEPCLQMLILFYQLVISVK